MLKHRVSLSIWVCVMLLEKKIKGTVGVSVEVIVHDPDGVPRSQGKAVRVIDRREDC